jgi:ribosomal-protein-alanine N-acetyltransferase
MQTSLQTRRLILRPFSQNDAPRLAWLAGDYDVARMCARLPHPYPIAAAFDFLEHLAAGHQARNEFAFALTAPIDGLIGACGIERAGDETSRTWELGYWLGLRYWGAGYASEAAGAVMNWAREQLGAARFTGAHFTDNPASGRVLRRLGFRPAGDEDRFSLARQQTSPAIRYVWPDGAEPAKPDTRGNAGLLH